MSLNLTLLNMLEEITSLICQHFDMSIAGTYKEKINNSTEKYKN